MRYLIFAFACMLTFACRGKADKNLYQVLDCISTVVENGKATKRFDFISTHQSLRIAKNGYCILVHKSGEAIELTGDNVIVVNNLILPNEGGTGEFTAAPKLELLFDPKSSNASQAWSDGASCMLPSQLPVVVGPKDDLCLSWSKGRGDKYEIIVSDLYSELLLAPFETEDTEMVLASEWLQDIPASIAEIVVTVYQNPRTMAICKVKINRDAAGRSFFRCFDSAEQSAMLAHLLEENGMHDAAKNFFQQAASRSRLPVYRELWELFESWVAQSGKK